MRASLKEWCFRFVLMGASVLIGLALAEVVARAFYPINDGRENIAADGKPIKEWFPKGTVYRQVSNEYDARTTITEKGHRVPGTAGNPDVIFIGDSFTYGYGLNDEETFPSIYCARQQRACVNLGMPGSGTSRQVRRLKEFLDRWQWHPREVKLFFFGMSGSFSAGNDFVDNYNYGRWLEAQSAGVSPGASPDMGGETTAPRRRSVAERMIGWQTSVLEHSTLMRRVKYHWGPLLKSVIVAEPGDRMAASLMYTERGLQELDALSRRAGFTYSIYLIVPVQDIMRGTHNDTLAALNKVSPRAAVTTAPLFVDSPRDYYYSFDGHLNPRGSRRIADFLVSLDNEEAGS